MRRLPHLPQAGAGVGRFKYEDRNGDKQITSADRDYIGNPNPDFTYGFNAKVFVKNFDLEALFMEFREARY